VLANVVKRYAGCRYRADQQYVPPAWIEFAGKEDFALTSVPVPRDFHETAVERDVERANQIRQEDEGIVKYPNYRQLGNRSAVANLNSKLVYSFSYFFR